ncbi:MAG: cob(I)yrinic acid a,c-diamide adenosyltransferase [Phycisphaerae bacterium]|nr:cob(I)yrinic acid a,c-diamide adenosyltransferase [Phycisphaerae bacterium]
MKLYTKTGDAGETSMADGSRVGKDDARPETVGTLDELNAHLGLARSACRDEVLCGRIKQLQREMFVLGCEVGLATKARPDRPELLVSEDMVGRLERWIDEATAAVPPLTHFILPGGDETASRLHVARTVCRRAERRLVALARSASVSEPTMRYVNRLSDLLYAWARQANHTTGGGDAMVDFSSKT